MGELNGLLNNDTSHSSKPAKKLLWKHPNPESTRMAAFMRGVNTKYGLKLSSYEELYRWSIHNIRAFWGDVWDFVGINAERGYDEVSFVSRD